MDKDTALDTNLTFNYRAALIAYVQSCGMRTGYALTIKRSDNKRGIVELVCDRGGDYRKRDSLTVEQRERKSGTRLIGCAVGKRRQRDGQWTFEVTCGEQNHEA
ncbi:hypothetical protein PsorP6_011363 [Peronosclerospora sorghi]|uniref:Uncharacterized protein n=1 Tax=Peronosclerospora sorghi TaxID=230839 RepID=A0ACC0WHM1_9STRA|nr:hypothetical protein PsorP6_011363 [Peronosclerospora sorghi]